MAQNQQVEEFVNYLQSINYVVYQEKGQRIMHPNDGTFFTDKYHDVKEHEVFISRLPHDLFEDELVPFLCRAGPVYQIRFIMNFSGSTKGMAYVVFQEVEDAYRAVEELDKEFIRHNTKHPVRVCFSVNNKRLFLKNLDKSKNGAQIKVELDKYLNGVKSVKIQEQIVDVNDTNCATVSFASHKFAAAARRLLVPGGLILWNRIIEADWAKAKDFKTLFIKLDTFTADQEVLRNFFHTGVSKVQKISLKNNYAFVKFCTFTDANCVYNHFKYFKKPINVSESIKILDISWPIRK